MNTALENTRDMGELGRFKLKNPTNSLSTKSTKFHAKLIFPQSSLKVVFGYPIYRC